MCFINGEVPYIHRHIYTSYQIHLCTGHWPGYHDYVRLIQRLLYVSNVDKSKMVFFRVAHLECPIFTIKTNLPVHGDTYHYVANVI